MIRQDQPGFYKHLAVSKSSVFTQTNKSQNRDLLVLLGGVWVLRILGQDPDNDFGQECCNLNWLGSCFVRSFGSFFNSYEIAILCANNYIVIEWTIWNKVQMQCYCRGFDLFWEIQAALVSIHRVLLLLLALTRENLPKGTSKSIHKLLYYKYKTAILGLFQQDFVNLCLTLGGTLEESYKWTALKIYF